MREEEALVNEKRNKTLANELAASKNALGIEAGGTGTCGMEQTAHDACTYNKHGWTWICMLLVSTYAIPSYLRTSTSGRFSNTAMGLHMRGMKSLNIGLRIADRVVVSFSVSALPALPRCV